MPGREAGRQRKHLSYINFTLRRQNIVFLVLAVQLFVLYNDLMYITVAVKGDINKWILKHT